MHENLAPTFFFRRHNPNAMLSYLLVRTDYEVWNRNKKWFSNWCRGCRIGVLLFEVGIPRGIHKSLSSFLRLLWLWFQAAGSRISPLMTSELTTILFKVCSTYSLTLMFATLTPSEGQVRLSTTCQARLSTTWLQCFKKCCNKGLSFDPTLGWRGTEPFFTQNSISHESDGKNEAYLKWHYAF